MHNHTLILCSCNGVMQWECECCEYVEPVNVQMELFS